MRHPSAPLRTGSGAPTVLAWDASPKYNYKDNRRSFDFAQDDKLWVGVRAIPGLKRDILRLRSGQALGHPLFLLGTPFFKYNYKGNCRSFDFAQDDKLWVGVRAIPGLNATSFGSAQDRLWGTHCSCLGRFRKYNCKSSCKDNRRSFDSLAALFMGGEDAAGEARLRGEEQEP